MIAPEEGLGDDQDAAPAAMKMEDQGLHNVTCNPCDPHAIPTADAQVRVSTKGAFQPSSTVTIHCFLRYECELPPCAEESFRLESYPDEDDILFESVAKMRMRQLGFQCLSFLWNGFYSHSPYMRTVPSPGYLCSVVSHFFISIPQNSVHYSRTAAVSFVYLRRSPSRWCQTREWITCN